MLEKNPDLKIPVHFMKIVKSWESLPNWNISNHGVSVSLAVNDYNERLKEMSETQIKNLDQSNIRTVHSWIKKGIVNPNCRGVPKS